MFLSLVSALKIAPEHRHPTRKKEVKAEEALAGSSAQAALQAWVEKTFTTNAKGP